MTMLLNLSPQQMAEKMCLNLPVFADGFGQGVVNYSFDGEEWAWKFGTGAYAQGFVASDEFIEKAVLENEKRIKREWSTWGFGC